MTATIKSRFAPSPTGFIHIGNARTALFSALISRGENKVFLLRIEDTDRDRSRDEFVHALQEDLMWLGIPWQEGPVYGGPHQPYHQSERTPIYQKYYDELGQRNRVYPCFCSDSELKLSRKLQLSSGQPPRYSGKCANLSQAEIDAKLAKGLQPTLRFRVPANESVEFDDAVRGKQVFRSADIGDFIIRRGDGSPAFFFCNAIDDALMQVTHVLRGEDHLTNTPRQVMILKALDLPLPVYGHISLIVGHDGSPLSKRHGSRSIRELREEGYFPGAVVNYLARLGHNYEKDEFQSVDELASGFMLGRLGRSPARYDAHQLLHWQHQAIAKATVDELWDWMGQEVRDLVPEHHKRHFVELVQPNISFPHNALHWAKIIFHDPLTLNDQGREIVAQAGRHFFQHTLLALDLHPGDFKAFADHVKKLTNTKGKELFMPLRVALTGEAGGPEMAKLFSLLGPERAKSRLHACLVG